MIVEGHAVAAGGLYEIDVHVDDLAGAGDRGELREELRPLRIAFVDGAGAAVETQDQRIALEGAEHDRHARVEAEVRGGLVAAAGEVEPQDPVGSVDPQRVHALGREVDPPLGDRGRDEEDLLPVDECRQARVERGISFGHAAGFLLNLRL